MNDSPAAPETTAEPPEDPAAAKAKKQLANMIPRRIFVPIGLWTEFLDMARSGGIDERDAMPQILDLGMQAQAEGILKPRYVHLDKESWEKVAAAAASLRESEQDTVIRLLDLGIQAKVDQLTEKGAPPMDLPLTGIPTKISVSGGQPFQAVFPDVPEKGEVMTVDGDPYVVEQRAWVVTGPARRVSAYLRVEPYPEEL